MHGSLYKFRTYITYKAWPHALTWFISLICLTLFQGYRYHKASLAEVYLYTSNIFFQYI
jgi:hypothetical protein